MKHKQIVAIAVNAAKKKKSKSYDRDTVKLAMSKL